jgi:superfamily II DNA/RNA helicase
MLDEYYFEQMKEVITNCSRTRQTMLFSATMTDQVFFYKINLLHSKTSLL